MNVIVVGGGKMGADLAGILCAGGHQVRVLELRAERLAVLRRELPPESVLGGSGTDPALLEAAGVRQAGVVAAVTGSDEANLVVTSLARLEFAVPRTIARVNNPRNAWMFTPQMGVDVALNPSDLMAHLIAEEMSLGEMMTLLKLRRGQFSLVEEKLDPRAPAVGKAVRELALPSECNLVAVLRGSRLLLPKPDLVLSPEDEVLAVVHSDHAATLAALLGVR
ncbi:MAG: TrkA family potassium uptake protein [Meiothermus sp.]|nr:TrkA family potassium uptake protein [Meiothermus sp.]